MKKSLIALVLALTIALTIGLTACSTAWVTTLDSILAAAAPALINILQIVALAENKPFNQALATKINADAAQVKTLAGDFASASTAAGPAVCSQLQAAISTYETDLPAVLAVAQVSNTGVQSKIAAVSSLVAGVFGAVEPLIPNCAAPATFKANLGATAPPLTLKNFVTAYNAVLVSPTGVVAVDARTPKLKLHEHSKVVRYASLGLLK